MLDLSNSKATTADKFNITEMVISVCDQIENVVENACNMLVAKFFSFSFSILKNVVFKVFQKSAFHSEDYPHHPELKQPVKRRLMKTSRRTCR